MWWKAVLEGFELEQHHFRLLRGCCEAWDRAETARREVKREGMFYKDRFGAPKPHPGLDIERKSRDQFRTLLRELGLDIVPPSEMRRGAEEVEIGTHLRLHGG